MKDQHIFTFEVSIRTVILIMTNAMEKDKLLTSTFVDLSKLATDKTK